MYAVEQYLFARSYMYAQVYHHKTVRAAEWMFIKTLERFRELARQGAEPAGLGRSRRMARGVTVPVDDYLRLHDVSVTAAIDSWAGRGPGWSPGRRDEVLRDLSQRLVSRRLFKTFDLGDDAGVADRLREPVERAAQARFGAAAELCPSRYRAADRLPPRPTRSSTSSITRARGGHAGGLLEDMPLGRPMATMRLLCAPELVDALEPIAERALRDSATSR